MIIPMSPVRADVGASAQLNRPSHGVAAALAHGHHTYFVAVFLAEQGARAPTHRILDGHQPGGNRRIAQYHLVGDVFDRFDLGRRHRLGMRKIEAQPVGRDQRAFLRDVVAEHLAQRLVQQVGGGMILPDGGASLMVDLKRERRTGLNMPCSTTPKWTNSSPAFFWVSVTRKRTPSCS